MELHHHVASATERQLSQHTAPIVARVLNPSGPTDLALCLSEDRLAVIRCADRARASDYSALATMVTAGDFVWAGLVYGERDDLGTPGLIETFHVSDLDALASRLSELREAIA